MKILQLCKKFPYPLMDGESIAISYLSKGLSHLGCEISLLAMNTSKHRVDLSSIPNHYNHYKEIHATSLDNRVKILDALLNLFSSKSYHITRFVSEEYKIKLKNLLQKTDFDLIQLETLYLTPYVPIIRKYSNAIICLRAHNIESEIWSRITENTKFLPKKWYLNLLTNRLSKYELMHLEDYDSLVTVSNKDLQKFKLLGFNKSAISSPIGLEIELYTSKEVLSCDDLCFIGSLDWVPNMEGLIWFCNKVFPLVERFKKNIKLNIAGRNTTNDIKKLEKSNIIIHGEVPDAIDFMNAYGIMIVPLLSGSGTRVKILEGLALGKLIVTTSIGLEGIEVEHKKHIMIADSPEDFSACISLLLNDKSLCELLRKEGQKYVRKYYDNIENSKILLSHYELLIKNKLQKHNSNK